ncbi:hypothetical protein [Pseudomonas syringae]|uniref:hypothetical protein n=1 Tax=Pseudomonas syringae TaxID=317 RepID=UPI0011430A8D|nr:hypothetical protein [Pseudomonas syringae]
MRYLSFFFQLFFSLFISGRVGRTVCFIYSFLSGLTAVCSCVCRFFFRTSSLVGFFFRAGGAGAVGRLFAGVGFFPGGLFASLAGCLLALADSLLHLFFLAYFRSLSSVGVLAFVCLSGWVRGLFVGGASPVCSERVSDWLCVFFPCFVCQLFLLVVTDFSFLFVGGGRALAVCVSVDGWSHLFGVGFVQLVLLVAGGCGLRQAIYFVLVDAVAGVPFFLVSWLGGRFVTSFFRAIDLIVALCGVSAVCLVGWGWLVASLLTTFLWCLSLPACFFFFAWFVFFCVLCLFVFHSLIDCLLAGARGLALVFFLCGRDVHVLRSSFARIHLSFLPVVRVFVQAGLLVLSCGWPAGCLFVPSCSLRGGCFLCLVGRFVCWLAGWLGCLSYLRFVWFVCACGFGVCG